MVQVLQRFDYNNYEKIELFQKLLIILIQSMTLNQFMRVDKVTTRVMATYVAPARNVLTSLLVQVNVGSRGPPSPEIDQYKENAYVSRSPKEPHDLLRDNILGSTQHHSTSYYNTLQYTWRFTFVVAWQRLDLVRFVDCATIQFLCVFLIFRKFGKDEEMKNHRSANTPKITGVAD